MQWREAIERYEFLIKKYPEALCYINVNCYAGIKQYYIRRLQSYPIEGRQIYRDMFDEIRRVEFKNAINQFRESGDIRSVTEMINANPLGDGLIDASILAGDYFAESNQYDKSIRYYRMAIENSHWRNLSADKAETRLKQGFSLENIIVPEKITDRLKLGSNNANNFEPPDIPLVANPMLELSWYCPFESIKTLFLANKEKTGNHADNSMNTAEPSKFSLCSPLMTDGKAYINAGMFIASVELESGKIASFFAPSLAGGQANFGNIKNNTRMIINDSGKRLYATIFTKSREGLLLALKIPELKELWRSKLSFNESGVSAPLFYGGNVYLCGFFKNNNEWQFCMLCYEADTGHLMYKKNIYSLNRVSKGIQGNLVDASWIAENKGFIYLLTPSVLSVINAEDGEIMWVNDYNTAEIIQLSEDYYGFAKQITEIMRNPPIIRSDIAVVQSIYSGKVFGFDIVSGRIKWQQVININRTTGTMKYQNQDRRTHEYVPRTEIVSIIGCAGDTVLIQGGDLIAINIENGKIVWKISMESICNCSLSQKVSTNNDTKISPGFITNSHVYFPVEQSIIIQDIPPGKSEPIGMKLPVGLNQPDYSNRVILCRISEGILVISNKGIWLYRIKQG